MPSGTPPDLIGDSHADRDVGGAHFHHDHLQLEEPIRWPKELSPPLPEPHPFKVGCTGYVAVITPSLSTSSAERRTSTGGSSYPKDAPGGMWDELAEAARRR